MKEFFISGIILVFFSFFLSDIFFLPIFLFSPQELPRLHEEPRPTPNQLCEFILNIFTRKIWRNCVFFHIFFLPIFFRSFFLPILFQIFFLYLYFFQIYFFTYIFSDLFFFTYIFFRSVFLPTYIFFRFFFYLYFIPRNSPSYLKSLDLLLMNYVNLFSISAQEKYGELVFFFRFFFFQISNLFF